MVLFTACAAAVERKAPATSQEDSFVKPGFGLERGLRTKPGRGIPLQPSRLPVPRAAHWCYSRTGSRWKATASWWWWLERGLRTKPGRGIPLHLQPSRLPPALVLFTACAAAVESDGVLVVVAAPALAQRVVGVHTGGRAVGLPRGSHWRLR